MDKYWIEFGATYVVDQNTVFCVEDNVLTGEPMVTGKLTLEEWEETKQEYINQGLRVEKIN